MADLPDYYFRIRDNGAAVFRIGGEDRNRRLDMQQIAVANVRNGAIKAQGDRSLTEADSAAIQAWLAERQEILAERERGAAALTVEALNLTTQWAQSKASDDELEAITEPLLLAMHDLRTVLIRRKSERIKDSRDES